MDGRGRLVNCRELGSRRRRRVPVGVAVEEGVPPRSLVSIRGRHLDSTSASPAARWHGSGYLPHNSSRGGRRGSWWVAHDCAQHGRGPRWPASLAAHHPGAARAGHVLHRGCHCSGLKVVPEHIDLVHPRLQGVADGRPARRPRSSLRGRTWLGCAREVCVAACRRAGVADADSAAGVTLVCAHLPVMGPYVGGGHVLGSHVAPVVDALLAHGAVPITDGPPCDDCGRHGRREVAQQLHLLRCGGLSAVHLQLAGPELRTSAAGAQRHTKAPHLWCQRRCKG